MIRAFGCLDCLFAWWGARDACPECGGAEIFECERVTNV